MIDINELTDSDVGRWVKYQAPHGAVEMGRIKSWNDKFVFVCYDPTGKYLDNWQNYTAAATKPSSLEFIVP